MASSTKNVKLGVCRAYLGGVDLGLTKGGVEVSVSTESYKVEVDQYGKTPIKSPIQGRMVTAKVPMAESTLQNIAALMPGATLVSDGVKASGTLTFGTITVTSTATIAGQAFTFTSGTPAGAYAVKIGTTVQETIDRFIVTFNRTNTTGATVGLVASQVGTTAVVKISAIDPGTAMNTTTIAAANGITASGATLTGGVAETTARLEVNTGVGTDLLDVAQELRLHPIGNAATDYSEDFVIHKAAAPGALAFAYKLDSERIFNADFDGYPDPVTGKLFTIGSAI